MVMKIITYTGKRITQFMIKITSLPYYYVKTKYLPLTVNKKKNQANTNKLLVLIIFLCCKIYVISQNTIDVSISTNYDL